jgi:hypothetical protein
MSDLRPMTRNEPLKVYEHAQQAGDLPLVEALARRLFPWRREHLRYAPSAAARLTVRRLMARLSRRRGAWADATQ